MTPMNQSTSSMSNEDIPVEIDDTQNVNAEYEDVQANIEYDLNCHVRIDSDENDTKRSDENIWYTTDENDDNKDEPTCYDSRKWVGHASFDDHNKSDLIVDEPINASFIETKFYEPSQRSPQRSNVRREWSVPGAEDYPFVDT